MQVETQHLDLRNQNEKNVHHKSKLDESIYSIVKKEGYISCDVRKRALPANGGNYLGILYEIDVTGHTADGENSTSIFVKSITPEASAVELLSIPSVYKTELFVYKELFKIFHELQVKADVPDNKRYKTVKCYDESYGEAIIMENLTKKGFKTWYRMDTVTFDMAEECIKQLGRLHGLSFALKQSNPEYFVNKIVPMKTAHKFDTTWEKFVEKLYNIGMESLGVDLKRKIGRKMQNIMSKMEEYINDQSFSCLCHGDYRPNNIMYKGVDGKVTEVLPVDYQLMYFGCPILDFIYFIYMATDSQFRRKHIESLKDIYYKSLGEFLEYFDISVESVFPKKVFDNLYHEKLDYGLMLSFTICPFLFVSEEEEVPDIMKNDLLDKELKFDDRFNERLRDCVEEFIELGYL